MRIEIADNKADVDYIRYARIETLKSVHVEPQPSLVEPIDFATYMIAYDEADQPIGMSEVAMLGDVYDSFEHSPYASLCDLNEFCPIEQMAGTRTIYVEPHQRHRPVFLALVLAGTRLFHSNGARFTTATTRGSDQYLNRLYEKCGGERVGTICLGQSEPSSLFVFEIEKMLEHRAVRRLSSYIAA